MTDGYRPINRANIFVNLWGDRLSKLSSKNGDRGIMHIIMLRFYGEHTSRIAINTIEPESRLDASGGDPVREVAHNQVTAEAAIKDSIAAHSPGPNHTD